MNPERPRERESDLEKAVEQGRRYLESEHQNGYFPSYISASRDFSAPPQISPRETFSTIVIADTALKDHPDSEATRAALQYIENQKQQGQFTFFEDRTAYPPDTDINSLGYSVLIEAGRPIQEDANRMLDSILAHRNEDGLVQVWLSHERQNRIDPVVSANALYLAQLLGRGEEMRQTEQWLLETLHTGAYQSGTRYYQSPDSFLHFMGRLSKFPDLLDKTKAKLAEQLQQRIGKTEYPLDLAMRAALADSLGIDNDSEKQKLLRLQKQGGSWPADALFQYGSQRGYFGSKTLTTAFSIRALESTGF
ncbi:MAG: hypothetical protein AAB444_00875 [Patescibacteria group bacterium]